MAEPNIGVLDQRVTGLEHGQRDLSTALNHLSTRIDDKFNNLGSIISERSRTQWPLLYSAAGLIISVMSIIGILAMRPTDNKIDDLEGAVKEIRLSLVPRAEHVEKAAFTAREFEHLRETVTDRNKTLSDQIEMLRAQYRNLYSAPDLLRDLHERIKSLEGQLIEAKAWGARVEPNGR